VSEFSLLPTGWSYLPGLLPAALICQSQPLLLSETRVPQQMHNLRGCRFSLSGSAIGCRSCQSRGHACKRYLIGHSRPNFFLQSMGPMRLKEGVLKSVRWISATRNVIGCQVNVLYSNWFSHTVNPIRAGINTFAAMLKITLTVTP